MTIARLWGRRWLYLVICSAQPQVSNVADGPNHGTFIAYHHLCLPCRLPLKPAKYQNLCSTNSASAKAVLNFQYLADQQLIAHGIVAEFAFWIYNVLLTDLSYLWRFCKAQFLKIESKLKVALPCSMPFQKLPTRHRHPSIGYFCFQRISR